MGDAGQHSLEHLQALLFAGHHDGHTFFDVDQAVVGDAADGEGIVFSAGLAVAEAGVEFEDALHVVNAHGAEAFRVRGHFKPHDSS